MLQMWFAIQHFIDIFTWYLGILKKNLMIFSLVKTVVVSVPPTIIVIIDIRVNPIDTISAGPFHPTCHPNCGGSLTERYMVTDRECKCGFNVATYEAQKAIYGYPPDVTLEPSFWLSAFLSVLSLFMWRHCTYIITSFKLFLYHIK